MYSRRDLIRLGSAAAAARSLLAKPDSTVNGVPLGAQSYSFRDRPLDQAIEAMRDIGLTYCELFNAHLLPVRMPRGEARRWIVTTPLDTFRTVREKFERAGIVLCGLSHGVSADATDLEIARAFEIARALGVPAITTSTVMSMVQRIDSQARRAGIKVGLHNHSEIGPDQITRPEDFDRALQRASEYIGINLDIGHLVAAGYDPLPMLLRHRGRFVTIHLKDRKRSQGDNVAFGHGDTPVKEVLQYLAREQRGVPAVIEYEYQGGDTITEVRRCFEYCKAALS